MMHLIAVVILFSILAANVIIAACLFIGARRREKNHREDEWREEIYRNTHPKLKDRYPD